MIISIRGTHGSGKSTIVRTVMEHYAIRDPIMKEGRPRPFGYLLAHRDRPGRLAIPGHYETPSGGCDNISAVEDMYNFVRSHAQDGADVLMEGILAQHYALKKFLTFSIFDPTVIVLTTPLDECIEDVIKRRGDTSPERRAKISDTVSREYRAVLSGAKRLAESTERVKVCYLDRTEALLMCYTLLQVPTVMLQDNV